MDSRLSASRAESIMSLFDALSQADLERYFGVNNNNHAVLVLLYLRVDSKSLEASIEFFHEVIARVTLFEAEISSVR